MNLVQKSFLEWIHKQEQHARIEYYREYEKYYNGDQPQKLPNKVKEALESELGTTDNLCKVVVDVPADYISAGTMGIEVPDSPDAEKFLYDVYEDNGLLDEEQLKLITIMGKKGDVFLKVYIEDKKIKVKVLRPELCFPRYKTEDYTEMAYCAIKWYDMESNQWKAQVFRDDVVEMYELSESEETEASQWRLVEEIPNQLGIIPIIHIKNTIDDLEFGISDLQPMLDLQDALNKTITDMLAAMDYTSFQRIFISGAQAPKGTRLSMEPGMITYLPDENAEMHVVESAPIQPYIEAMREIVDHVCTVTSIPKIAFSRPEGGPISGYALRVHYIPLERKCKKKEVVLSRRLRQLNQLIFMAAKLLEIGDYTGVQTKVHFEGGLPIDDMSQVQVAEIELRNKIKSRRTIMQERGIEDVDKELQIIRDEDNEDYLEGTRIARERTLTERGIEAYTAQLTTPPLAEEGKE